MSVECAATAPVHPGRILINELEKLGMSQKELAVRTGVTEKHVSTIITGKKISPQLLPRNWNMPWEFQLLNGWIYRRITIVDL